MAANEQDLSTGSIACDQYVRSSMMGEGEIQNDRHSHRYNG